jgi:predicted  nucleic acid-binding Zn-ribbon protein
MNKVDVARKKMEIARVKNSKMEQELKILELEEQIERIQGSITISDEKIKELEDQLAEMG